MDLKTACNIFGFTPSFLANFPSSEGRLWTLRRRYRELALSCHPDREGGDPEKFRSLSSAYEALLDYTPPTPQKTLHDLFLEWRSSLSCGGVVRSAELLNLAVTPSQREAIRKWTKMAIDLAYIDYNYNMNEFTVLRMDPTLTLSRLNIAWAVMTGVSDREFWSSMERGYKATHRKGAPLR